MAFRSEAKRCGLILLAAAAICAAQTAEADAVEKRMGRDRPGRLVFAAGALEFRPAKGKARRWALSEVQRLELSSEGEVRLTLYRDVRWKADRDERIRFQTKNLPGTEGLARALRAEMGERFIPRLVLEEGPAVWRGGAKLLRGWGGPEGEFVLAEGGWYFRSPERGHSISVEDRGTGVISSNGELQLSVASSDGRDSYEFLLKAQMPREVYDAWWRRLNRPRGLELIEVQKEQSK